MTATEIQAAVNAYNEQIPTYSGGKSTAWAIAPTAQYDIFGRPVTTGETREETAVRVATGGGSAGSAETVIDRGVALIADNLVLIAIAVLAVVMIPRLISSGR
jgi:membrane protein required for beta-lactamase induction